MNKKDLILQTAINLFARRGYSNISMVDGLARLNTYGIYEAGALYDDFINLIRKTVYAPDNHIRGNLLQYSIKTDKFRPVK